MLNEEAMAGLVARVEQLSRERDEDRVLLEELHLALATGGRAPSGEPVFPDWQTWVEQWLAPRVSRSPHRQRWCNRYAEHPEVADRLEALWHTWEAAWPDPLARPAWFRDGLDHHLAVIRAEDGPLRFCSAVEREHRDHEPG